MHLCCCSCDAAFAPCWRQEVVMVFHLHTTPRLLTFSMHQKKPGHLTLFYIKVWHYLITDTESHTLSCFPRPDIFKRGRGLLDTPEDLTEEKLSEVLVSCWETKLKSEMSEQVPVIINIHCVSLLWVRKQAERKRTSHLVPKIDLGYKFPHPNPY